MLTVGEFFEILENIIEELKQSGYSPDYVDVKVEEIVQQLVKENNLATV